MRAYTCTVYPSRNLMYSNNVMNRLYVNYDIGEKNKLPVWKRKQVKFPKRHTSTDQQISKEKYDFWTRKQDSMKMSSPLNLLSSVADPWYFGTDPDPDPDPSPDPAIFVTDLQDGYFFLLLLFEAKFTSFFRDKTP